MSSEPRTAVANLFAITSLPVVTYHQYGVAFEPEVKNVRRREVIMHQFSVQYPAISNPRFVYDGRAILYTPRVLDGGTFRVKMTGQGALNHGAQPTSSSRIPPRGFVDVILNRTQSAMIRPLELNSLIRQQGNTLTVQSAAAINLLQLLIRQGQNWINHPRTNRAYYIDPYSGRSDQNSTLQSSVYEFWYGYFQSVRPTIGRMVINIDVTMATMIRRGRIIDISLCLLEDLGQIGRRPNVRELRVRENDSKFRALDRFFKNKGNNLMVSLEYMAAPSMVRKKKIYGLEPLGGRYVFTMSDGSSTTVEDFFKSQYNIQLLYPDIFGLVLSHPHSPNRIVVPAELCSIDRGQFLRGKLPESEARKMQACATLNPKDRLECIRNGTIKGAHLEGPLQQYSTNDLIQGSGMRIECQPLEIRGRRLDPPQLRYHSEGVKPVEGAWNVRGKLLYTPKPLKNWAIVNYEPSIPMAIVEEFKRTLVECCRNLGMKPDEPSYVENANPQSGTKNLNDAIRTMNPETFPDHPPLILAILPQNAADLRANVKLWGDTFAGVHTQCIREGKIYNHRKAAFNDQYCNNVALKINARLGGTNFIVGQPSILSQMGRRPFMIIGADISHSGPGVSDRPSIASLVYSTDVSATRYVAISRLQPPRQEIILHLRDMITEIFAGVHPSVPPPLSIVFYRDGVSESQYSEVAAQEIAAINSAIEKVWKAKNWSPKPGLTFIVVTKRHHVRLFPQNGGGNCPAGFVADVGIQSPFASDFYLQSHAGLLGTSKSSHYTVLLDEVFEGDIQKIQHLSFELCHVYAKATRSVSIPAPVYYAHLVCSRANFYFDPRLDYTGSDSATAASGGTGFDLSLWEQGYKSINKRIKNSMYYL